MPKTGRRGRGFYPRRSPDTSRKALRLAKFGPSTDAGGDSDKGSAGASRPKSGAGGLHPVGQRPPGRRGTGPGPAGGDKRQARSDAGAAGRLRPPESPTGGGGRDGRIVPGRDRPRHGGNTPQFDRRRDGRGPSGGNVVRGPKQPYASLLPGEIRDSGERLADQRRSGGGDIGRNIYGGTPRVKPNSKGLSKGCWTNTEMNL